MRTAEENTHRAFVSYILYPTLSKCCGGPSDLSPAQKQQFMINGVLKREVYTDGEFMQDPRREKVFYTEVRRFVGPS